MEDLLFHVMENSKSEELRLSLILLAQWVR